MTQININNISLIRNFFSTKNWSIRIDSFPKLNQNRSILTTDRIPFTLKGYESQGISSLIFHFYQGPFFLFNLLTSQLWHMAVSTSNYSMQCLHLITLSTMCNTLDIQIHWLQTAKRNNNKKVPIRFKHYYYYFIFNFAKYHIGPTYYITIYSIKGCKT